MKYGLSEGTYLKIKGIVEKYSNYKFKIFGSRARGDYKKNSDIDIAILNCTDDREKFKIRNDFDLLDIPYTIDVLFVEEISKEELLKSIERDGIIYE